MALSPATSTELPAPPARKPMAAARRVSLYEREIRVKLSSAAIDILFDLATVLSEGQRHGNGYFGSTMVTFELDRAAAAVRDVCDAATAQRVAELLAQDQRVRVRTRELAAAEAARRLGARVAKMDVDMRVRATGTKVHIDLDVEGEVTLQSG